MKNPYPLLELQGITNPKVLTAIRALPRELFITPELQVEAYIDSPLPIDCGQTISQPFIVAYMTEQLDLKSTDKVLEIGTGSGFQSAVLAQLVHKVYTIEFYPELTQKAQQVLNKLGYKNIKYKIGDGKEGWREFASFDKIIITALTEEIPPALLNQLKIDGKMILPLRGSENEEYLFLVNKLANGEIVKKKLIGVRFVPLL